MASWKDVVKGVAPAIATALGGPQAGAAVKVLSQRLLGKDNGTEEEIAVKVQALTPEEMFKLKQAEEQFTAMLLDKATALEQVDAGDRANARAREAALKDWIPAALALATAAAFFALLWLMMTHTIPKDNEQPFNILLGIMAGAMTQVLNYYFGSSSGSASARTVIGRIAERKQ